MILLSIICTHKKIIESTVTSIVTFNSSSSSGNNNNNNNTTTTTQETATYNSITKIWFFSYRAAIYAGGIKTHKKRLKMNAFWHRLKQVRIFGIRCLWQRNKRKTDIKHEKEKKKKTSVTGIEHFLFLRVESTVDQSEQGWRGGTKHVKMADLSIRNAYMYSPQFCDSLISSIRAYSWLQTVISSLSTVAPTSFFVVDAQAVKIKIKMSRLLGLMSTSRRTPSVWKAPCGMRKSF